MTRLAHPTAVVTQGLVRRDGVGSEDAHAMQAWERDCLARSAAGDIEAFGELLRAYQARVFSLIARWVVRRDEAHELTQEAFLIAFRERHRFDAKRPFRPWLFKIAVNVCRNHLRRHERREQPQALGAQVTGVWNSESATPETDASTHEDNAKVIAALQTLTAADRGILLLRFREDLSYAELATVMGRPQALLKVRVHRALKRLRRALEAP